MELSIVVGKYQNKKKEVGVTYLWLLFIVFLLTLGLGKSLEVYSQLEQKNKENDLIYIGLLYQDAIKQYYISGPLEKKYPKDIKDLLKDPRYIVARRYIRKLYLDPMTNEEFILIYSPEGGVCGVRSSSSKQPFRKKFNKIDLNNFNLAKHYYEWEFKYLC